MSSGLTQTAINAAKGNEKPYKLTDGLGMYLLVNLNGSRLWRLKYRFEGREKVLALGAYPAVSLKGARTSRDEARKHLAAGIDPGAKKQAEKAAAENSFEAVARQWFDKFSPKWAVSNVGRVKRQLERDLLPWLGNKPVNTITPPELLAVLRRIENRGAIETAHRARQMAGQIFRYGVACGYCERDPSQDLKGAIPPAQGKNYPAITKPAEVGALMRAIASYKGSFVMRCALQFTALTAARSGELRGAEWSEIDLDAALWTVPANRMKGRREHRVMLSKQAVALLKELHPLSGQSAYVFPSERSMSRQLSDNSLNAALRYMGYSKEQMTTHGFRAMFSSIANESGWDADAIERSLAHIESNDVRRAYHRSEYVEERKKLMQWWADYLDALRIGAKVIPIKRGA